jgi:hypothetical protein
MGAQSIFQCFETTEECGFKVKPLILLCQFWQTQGTMKKETPVCMGFGGEDEGIGNPLIFKFSS